MIRIIALTVFFTLLALPAYAKGRRAASAAKATLPAIPEPALPVAAALSPSVAPAKAEAQPAYDPPAGSLQPPLTAVEVCRALRAGLSGAEVAQDLRERGFTGAFSNDEAADARAAGASAELVAALGAGRFTVSADYAQRYAAQAAQSQQAKATHAWRAQAYRQLQGDEQRFQATIVADNVRAIIARERENYQRSENMKAQADWAAQQRGSSTLNNGDWYHGRWYASRFWSSGS